MHVFRAQDCTGIPAWISGLPELSLPPNMFTHFSYMSGGTLTHVTGLLNIMPTWESHLLGITPAQVS